MKKGFFAVILVVVMGLMFILGGCAGVQVEDQEMTVAQAMTGVATGYVIAMTVSADLYRAGIIDSVARAQVVTVGNVFYKGFTSLVDVLETGDLAAIQTAIAQLSSAGSDLSVLVAALAGTNTAAVAAVVTVTSILAQAYLAPAISAAITESGPQLAAAEATTLRALVKPPETYFGLVMEVVGESD